MPPRRHCPEGKQPPVLAKHRWNPIRVTDVYEMAKATPTGPKEKYTGSAKSDFDVAVRAAA